jgi:hypothetical protein
MNFTQADMESLHHYIVMANNPLKQGSKMQCWDGNCSATHRLIGKAAIFVSFNIS